MELLQNVIQSPPLETREAFFEDLYESCFPAFARFAAKMGASFQDAKDVFQDAMVVYCEKRSDPGFEVRISPEAYILGVARHLWLKKFSRDRKHVSLENAADFELPADYFPDEKESMLLSFLETSGKKCMDLLRKFYFDRTSLKDIASALGFRTEHSAAVQKYKCIGKVRDAIKERSLRYEDFRN